MANLGAEAELVNAQKLTLNVGVTPDLYVMLQECTLHMGRPESRQPTTDGGVIYYYGKGDHSMTATILVTTPEITTLNALTELTASGDMTSDSYKIICTPKGGGAAVTVTVNAVLRGMDIEKPVEGGVLFRLDFRITDDTVTVTP